MRVEVVWHHQGGSLTGWIEVVNDDTAVLRLPGKPSVSPLAPDGAELGVRHVITLEMKVPGHVDLLPDQRTRAPVSWAAWDGPAAGGDVLVRWPGADSGSGTGSSVEVRVTVRGPHQPVRTTGALTTSSSWFDLER